MWPCPDHKSSVWLTHLLRYLIRRSLFEWAARPKCANWLLFDILCLFDRGKSSRKRCILLDTRAKRSLLASRDIPQFIIQGHSLHCNSQNKSTGMFSPRAIVYSWADWVWVRFSLAWWFWLSLHPVCSVTEFHSLLWQSSNSNLGLKRAPKWIPISSVQGDCNGSNSAWWITTPYPNGIQLWHGNKIGLFHADDIWWITNRISRSQSRGLLLVLLSYCQRWKNFLGRSLGWLWATTLGFTFALGK